MVGVPEIELREEARLLEHGKGRGDERNGVAVLHRDGIETSVIDGGPECTILLPHKEEAGPFRGRGTNEPSCQTLPNVPLHGETFWCREGEEATPGRAGAGE